jgi:hypothetical protein
MNSQGEVASKYLTIIFHSFKKGHLFFFLFLSHNSVVHFVGKKWLRLASDKIIENGIKGKKEKKKGALSRFREWNGAGSFLFKRTGGRMGRSGRTGATSAKKDVKNPTLNIHRTNTL